MNYIHLAIQAHLIDDFDARLLSIIWSFELYEWLEEKRKDGGLKVDIFWVLWYMDI